MCIVENEMEQKPSQIFFLFWPYLQTTFKYRSREGGDVEFFFSSCIHLSFRLGKVKGEWPNVPHCMRPRIISLQWATIKPNFKCKRLSLHEVSCSKAKASHIHKHTHAIMTTYTLCLLSTRDRETSASSHELPLANCH